MHVSNQPSNFLPMEVTPWLCTREGNVSFKKQCQDREQLILTIFNRLTSQCNGKKKQKTTNKGAARERQQRPHASGNNEKDGRGLGKIFTKFEKIKLVFLEAHPFVDL